jgi:two-component system, response regulator / RNA-binding antiterminator
MRRRPPAPVSRTSPSKPGEVVPMSAPPAAAAPAGPSAGLRVLLIDDGAHRVGLIRDELARQGCDVVGVIEQATLIHDCVQRLAPDVVIVDSESPTRDTLEHLSLLSSRNPRPVVVFSETDAEDPMRLALKAGVSAYVVAGLRPDRLAPVLKVAIARYEQEAELRAQLDGMSTRLAQRKTIERAKGLLMKSAGLDEETAFQRLRRQAMDRGLALHDVALKVIEAHELRDAGLL